MTIRLRQICLVARELKPVIDDLTTIPGINTCFVDPGVGKFGLENTLMPVGKNFLEVVAPLEEVTAERRYLDRRGGDGGYMVITQVDTLDNQQAIRQRALDKGVRVAYESERDGWILCQLHPRDMIAAFFEIEWDVHEDFEGHWNPVGGVGFHEISQRPVSVSRRTTLIVRWRFTIRTTTTETRVDCDRPLVTIEVEKPYAQIISTTRTNGAKSIPLRRLHLDDIGTQVA